jgi:hypothetical protein
MRFAIAMPILRINMTRSRYFSSSKKTGKRAGGGVYKGSGAEEEMQEMLREVQALLCETWGGVIRTPSSSKEAQEQVVHAQVRNVDAKPMQGAAKRKRQS